MSGVDVLRHEGAGYLPVVDYGAWRVALMNASEATKEENIQTLQRHDETDEVFVLLAGECTLILSDAADAPGEMYRVRLQPGRVYNVRRGVWHNHVLSADARVLVVENRDTSKANSPRVPVPYAAVLEKMAEFKEDDIKGAQ